MSILFSNARIYDKAADGHAIRGFVATDGEKITYVGQTRPEGTFTREIDCTTKLLIPGFYNAHCHSAMTIFRGYGEDLPLDRWLNERIFPAEERLTPESVYYGSMIAIAEMLRCGVVSFTDMYYFCEDTARAVEESGIKANLSRSIVCFDADNDLSGDERMEEAKALARDYHGAADGRIKIDMSLHAEYTNTPKSAAAVADFARANGLMIQIHLSETEKEHWECIDRHQKTPTRFFLDAGVFDVPVSAAHCVYLTDDDMAILAERGATAVHNPVSNLKLGSGVMRLPQMVEAGVQIALGTDGAASNNQLSVLRELQTAAILHKGIGRQADVTTAAQMLDYATINGAKSQGRENCGMIMPGARADIVLIELDTLNNMPYYDAASTLCYSATTENIALTMVDGRILYEDGRYTTFDIDKLRHDAAQVFAHYFD